MVPLLLCGYKPRYLAHVLEWLQTPEFKQRYRIFAWDNGGADTALRAAGLEWHCVRDERTQAVVNVGKAMAMWHLVDRVRQDMPDADCYVCMDDDIVADSAHLDALVAAARRPGLGMIAARFHPFNAVVPDGGRVVQMDACGPCGGPEKPPVSAPCRACNGTGWDPAGLRLRIYPEGNRTVHRIGQVAGGLFAVSTAALRTLPWAPHLYPMRLGLDQKPLTYWTEDASLDYELTKAGLTNGYLASETLTPAIHLPDLNPAYVQWKKKACVTPVTSNFEDDPA